MRYPPRALVLISNIANKRSPRQNYCQHLKLDKQRRTAVAGIYIASNVEMTILPVECIKQHREPDPPLPSGIENAGRQPNKI
jgi:hypothetical protein